MNQGDRRDNLAAVDHALDVLARSRWDGPEFDAIAEVRIMSKTKAGRMSRKSVWIAAGAVALLGTGAFAAAGGFEAIRSMFSGRVVFEDESGNQQEVEITGNNAEVEWTDANGVVHKAVPVDPSQLPASGRVMKMAPKEGGR